MGHYAQRALTAEFSTTSADANHWEQAIGERAVTSGELARLVNPAIEGFCQPSLREALLMIAAVRGEVNAQKLGNWLSKIKGRQVKGKWIDQAPMLNGFKRWKLVSGGSL